MNRNEVYSMSTLTNIPQWTADDYYGDTVYAWLYEHQDNKFLFQRFLAQAQIQARALKIVGFSRMWNAYVESQDPRKNAVYISDTQFPNQPVTLQCGKYLCDDRGITYTGVMGDTVEVCTHPLMPVRRVINVDTNEEKMEIAYSRGRASKWRTIITSRDVTASAQKIISLSKNGIAVNSENAKEIVKYLSSLESLNFDALPVQNSTGHMGWLPDGQFAPYAKDIVYDGESPEFSKMYKSFDEHGKEETWMDIAKQVRHGNSVPARVALAASFAAPLVQKLGALPFFVHLWGTQGCGKTVGLMLAASVWGNPDVGNGFIKTFAGTKVSLELYAAFCGNIPILLDELQVISDRRSFDDIIYTLCEGVSKGRGAKEGGLQLQRKWSSCIITTGEMPIVQSNSGGGAAVRTIEINYGGQPLFDDARTVANTLKENYGFAGRKFIDALGQDGVMDAMKAKQRKYYSQLAGDIQDKQVLSASILLAADFLADKALFHDGKALTVEEIMPYLITRDEADVNNRCYQWLMGYIAGNPRRFDTTDNNQEVWGVIEKGVAYIIKPFFERMLRSEGYSPGAFMTWARRNNKIIIDAPDKNGNNKRLTKRKKIGENSVPCVAVVMDTIDDMPTRQDYALPTADPVKAAMKGKAEEYVEVKDDEDMPF